MIRQIIIDTNFWQSRNDLEVDDTIDSVGSDGGAFLYIIYFLM